MILVKVKVSESERVEYNYGVIIDEMMIKNINNYEFLTK
jgi:hypothetical protein